MSKANDDARRLHSEAKARVASRAQNRLAQQFPTKLPTEYEIPITYDYQDYAGNSYTAHVYAIVSTDMGGFSGIVLNKWRFEDAQGNEVEMPPDWDVGDQGPIVSEIAAERYPEIDMAANAGDEEELRRLVQQVLGPTR